MTTSAPSSTRDESPKATSVGGLAAQFRRTGAVEPRSTEETTNEVDQSSTDHEDENDTAHSDSEANRQGEHILENDGKCDEDSTQSRESVET
jgi:hypothetical protein